MNKKIGLSLIGMLLGFNALSANAFSIDAVKGQYFTTETNATNVDFDSGLPSFYSGGQLFSSSIPGVTSKPVGGEGKFWSIGDSGSQDKMGAISFESPVSYFGFLFGSPDSFNQVNFYSGSQLIGSLSGEQLVPYMSGNGNTSFYINAYAGVGEVITLVMLDSGENAIETDNHAYTVAVSAVPEPETYAMMLGGLAMMGLIARRRKSVV